MSGLPELTCCVVGCRRPWYYVQSIQAVINRVGYAGARRFLISDGGSPEHELAEYRRMLAAHKHAIHVTGNLAAMMNACAQLGGEVWFTTLDDFIVRHPIDVTNDVRFLLENPDVGAIRMGRLAHWEHGPNETIVGELRTLNRSGQHYWVIRKGETTHPYIHCINTFLYHRRFWDAYGDIPDVAPDVPGEAEVEAARLFNEKDGPTIAIPMRFGQNVGEWHREPVEQLPSWRTPEYAASGQRWM